MSRFVDFFNNYINPYMMYVCLGLSVVWIRWLIGLSLPRWVFITLLVFNPYVWYGLFMMWHNRVVVLASYEQMRYFWRLRYPRDEKK